MTINLNVPATHELKPKILVFGVGGAGCNAVNNMITSHLEGVEFVVANTDAQSLEQSLTERRIQLGATTTQGLGAGAHPEVGRQAAEEALENIQDHLRSSNMVFITCGMGGGTGTGAAPVIARAAREDGILTIGVATKPFNFEGHRRMEIAEAGLAELQQVVDTLIVIPNNNLFRVASEKTTFAEAFKMADDVLYSGVRGVTDLMVMPGLINLDFADVRSVMREMGKAMMGTGESGGENGEKRALNAAEDAINNPLLDDVSLSGARGVLINITGGPDLTLFEVDEACTHIREQVDRNAKIIFGSTFDDSLAGRVRVSVVATGIDCQEDDDVAAAGVEHAVTPSYAPAPSEPVAPPHATIPAEPAPPRVETPTDHTFAPASPPPAAPDHAPAAHPREPVLAGWSEPVMKPETPASPPPASPDTGSRRRPYDWMRSLGGAPAAPTPPPAHSRTSGRASDSKTDEIPPFLRRNS